MILITAAQQTEFRKAARSPSGRRRIRKVLEANQHGRDRIAACLTELLAEDAAAEADEECIAARQMLSNIEEATAWLEKLLRDTSKEIEA